MSESNRNAPPISLEKLLDQSFIAHRAKLLDIAAFLDRCDRASNYAEGKQENDPRLADFQHAIELLHCGQPDRAKLILEHFSDLTPQPSEAAAPGPATGTTALSKADGESPR
jgi:hypothetical protein